jgi:hypothetical protein
MTRSRSFRRELATIFAVVLIAGSSTSSALGAIPRPAPEARPAAATDVVGQIESDTTWTKAASPYTITGQVIVRAGVTLTIEAGVDITVSENGSFVVNGNLVAIGTRAAPITIAGTGPGSWPGLFVTYGGQSAPSAHLAFVTISGGGGSGGHGDQLYGYAGTVDLDEVTLRDGGGNGITIETGTLRMRGGAISGNPGDAIVATGLHTGGGEHALDVEGVEISGNGNNAAVLHGPGGFDADGRLRDIGVPYEIRGQIVVSEHTTLTVDPGVEIRFADQAELVVNGAIDAQGTAERPITFRGVADGTGTWYGLRVIGGQEAALATFDHVTIRDAGQSQRTALSVTNGRLQLLNSEMTKLGGDAIVIDGGAWPGTSRIEGSSIEDIAGLGVRNDTTGVVIATRNWWGDASGPRSDDTCATGSGTSIKGLVRTAPWLTARDARPDPLAPAPYPVITLSPERWYAPADGQTRIWVNLTLRDPQGRPVAGRKIDLHSTLGTVTTGGLTDAAGTTRAWLVSDQPGDGELTAVLADSEGCSFADAGEALVTFRDVAPELLAGMQAPYMYDGLEIGPEPVIQGVETKVRARLTNTNAEPVKVEVEFGYADYGIGLTFGPIGTVTGEIPANGETTFETTWLPPISGHYCLEVQYRIIGSTGSTDANRLVASIDWQPASGDPFFAAPGGGGGRANSNVGGGNPAGNLPKPPPSGGGGNQEGPGLFGGFFKSMGFGQPDQISSSLGGDPPRQDYDQVASIVPLTVQYWPREAGWSDARWAAEQALTDALFDYSEIGIAAITSLDRYGGATAANELRWAAVQASSLLHFRDLLGVQAEVVADKVGALAAIVEQEAPDEAISLADATAFLDRLRTSGYTAEELAYARAMGADDVGIAHMKEIALRQTPESLARRTAVKLRKVEAYYRELGPQLGQTRMFPEQSSATAGLGNLTAADAPSELAAITDASTTFELGNPLDTTATIDLRTRPISLPAGWTATLSTTQVTLDPGKSTTITVTIVPSGPAVQGTIARVAVEGYINGELLDGVVAGVLIPEYVPFSANPSDSSGGPTLLIIVGVAVIAIVVLLAGALLLLRRRRPKAA